MRSFLVRLRSLFFHFGLRRKMTAVELRLVELDNQRRVSDEELSDCQQKFEDAKEQLTRLIDDSDRDLKKAKKLHQKYENELEASRNELKIMKDVTIPGLVAANKLLLAQWDAETAIQVRRQVASLPSEI